MNDTLGKPTKNLKTEHKETEEKENRAAEFLIANEAKVKRAAELDIAKNELSYQAGEKADRAAELVIANIEKANRAAELAIANKEKANRAAERVIAEKELSYQAGEKADRASELVIANKELKFQGAQKKKRAAELVIANKELKFQNDEKERRAAELVIANKELEFQGEQKEKRAAELITANKELKFQNDEKEKRAAELVLAIKRLKQTEKGLKQSEERLLMDSRLRNQQKLEAIGTLASGVAHEINNPINGILNYSQIILDSDSDDKSVKEYASEIIAETNRVAEIVRNLLDFARSYAKIEDIISQTISLISTMVKHDQIELTLNIAKNLPQVKCRTQQIQQVLMNLMTNARDASNAKYSGYNENKKINLSCTQYNSEGRKWLKLIVEDHGVGISKDTMTRIFDPFFTTKGRTQGTGLGLSISYSIVKEHHGEINVESEEGKFTRFTVKLPCDNGWDLE